MLSAICIVVGMNQKDALENECVYIGHLAQKPNERK